MGGKKWGGKNLHDLIDEEIKGKYEVKNMNDLTKQQIRKYKIDRSRLIKDSKHYVYVHEDILMPIIMHSIIRCKILESNSRFHVK